MLVTLDFETYYDRDYSLRKMTTAEYILDKRFEAICCAIRLEQLPGTPPPKVAAWDETRVYRGPDLPLVFASIPWDSTTLLCHNTAFDASILSWRYGHKPKFYLDTMSMAQAVYGHRGMRVGLGDLAPLVGDKKDSGALANMQGVRYADVDWGSPERQRFVRYATQDVDTCRALFELMMREGFPREELLVIDDVLRMFVEPRLALDLDLLREHLLATVSDAKEKVAASGYPASALRSRSNFAQILEDLGVEPPTKVSDRTGEETHAFAKTDQDFAQLLVHPDEKVRAVCEARLAVSSTIEKTRSERLIAVGEASSEHFLPVPLKYSGAHTHRFSGRDSINLQNLGRTSPIRRAVVARRGRKLVVADASQIEARLNAWLAGEFGLCDQFGRGEDVYATFAGKVYGRPINKEDDPLERRVGKTGVLGLGFGCGPPKFQWMLAVQAKTNETEEFCRNVVQTYRAAYPGIPALWRKCDGLLERMANPQVSPFRFGPFMVGYQHIVLPTGLRLEYPGLRFGDNGMVYTHPTYGAGHSIWGGTVTENLVQALDHVVITSAMKAMRRHLPRWQCVLQVHDELVYECAEEDAEECAAELVRHLCATPAFADTRLQLGAEYAIVDRYGDAK